MFLFPSLLENIASLVYLVLVSMLPPFSMRLATRLDDDDAGGGWTTVTVAILLL